MSNATSNAPRRPIGEIVQLLKSAIYQGSMTRDGRTAALRDWLNKPVRDLLNADLRNVFERSTLDPPPFDGRRLYLTTTFDRWLQAQRDKDRNGWSVAREIYEVLKEFKVSVARIAELEESQAEPPAQTTAVPPQRPVTHEEPPVPVKPSPVLAPPPPSVDQSRGFAPAQRFATAPPAAKPAVPSTTPAKQAATAQISTQSDTLKPPPPKEPKKEAPIPPAATAKPQVQVALGNRGGYLTVEADGMAWYVLKGGQRLPASTTLRGLGYNEDGKIVESAGDLLNPSVRSALDLDLSDVAESYAAPKLRAKDRNKPARKHRHNPESYGG